MAVPKTTLWKRDPHTAEKHAILRGYLDAWWPIILLRFPGATYAEGFSGPGEYEGGEDGSPLEALHALLKRNPPAPVAPSRFVLVEEDERRLQHLAGVIADRYPALPRHVDVRLRLGSCGNTLIPSLDEADSFGQPIFAMLDPFNVAVPYTVVQRIGVNRSSEVLVTLMSSWLTRWALDEGQAQGDLMFGGREWREVAKLPPDDKKAFLVGLYRQRLTEAGFPLQLAFELIDEGGHAFFLIFGTANKLGLEKMKDSMWSRDRVHGVRFRDPRDHRQLAFEIEEHPDLGGLETLLSEHMVIGQEYGVEELREWALLQTVFRPLHAHDVLRKWAADGHVEVVGGGRPLKASTVALTRRPPLHPLAATLF